MDDSNATLQNPSFLSNDDVSITCIAMDGAWDAGSWNGACSLVFGPNGWDDNLDRTDRYSNRNRYFFRTITDFFPVDMGGNILFFSLNPLK